MSAWTVSKTHIDLMIQAAESGRNYGFSWYHNGSRTTLSEMGKTAAGQMLWDENFLSVNYRYQEGNAAPAYNFKINLTIRIDPVIVLKQISCYEYQTCEHKDWESSEAKAFCDALRGQMISRLPGYDDAPWGVHDKPGDDDDDESIVVILSDLVTTRIWDTSDPSVREVKPDDDANDDDQPNGALFDF